jgi:hypothetical protein
LPLFIEWIGWGIRARIISRISYDRSYGADKIFDRKTTNKLASEMMLVPVERSLP